MATVINIESEQKTTIMLKRYLSPQRLIRDEAIRSRLKNISITEHADIPISRESIRRALGSGSIKRTPRYLTGKLKY